MATYKAVTNGDWSSLSTWQDNATGSFIASTVLPGVNDAVYTNNFIVQVNQNISVFSLSNKLATGVVVGGVFEVGISVNITTSNGIYGRQGAGPVILSAFSCVYIKSNSIVVNIQSDVYGSDGFTAGGYYGVGIYCDKTATITLTGNLYGGTGIKSPAFYNAASANITIIGDLVAGTVSTSYAFENIGASVVFITGNQNANVAPAIFNTGNALITIIGNQSASFSPAISTTASGATLNVTGTCSASSTAHGIINSQSAANIIYAGILVNIGKIIAIFSPCLYLDILVNTSYWSFQKSDQLTNNSLYAAGILPGVPSEMNVRNGVVFGPSNELTGSLIVPDPLNVRKGVPTDSTIGSAELTADDLLAAIEVSANPVAVRLRNVATVQSTGDQITAFSS
jgi:hypothetical protein